MVTNTTLLLIFVTLASVTAQTFQYSRGWTNGKRDGHRRNDDVREAALEKILSPCQMNKLRYVLEGKPFHEKVFAPCDYPEDYSESQPKRFRNDHQEALYDAFQ